MRLCKACFLDRMLRSVKGIDMSTNLVIDDSLLREALRLGGHSTKRQAVNQALKEYIQRRRRLAVLKLLGTVEFDTTYDYKRERRKR